MKWFFNFKGDILVVVILAVFVVLVIQDLFRKKTACGSCAGCSMGCDGCKEADYEVCELKTKAKDQKEIEIPDFGKCEKKK